MNLLDRKNLLEIGLDHFLGYLIVIGFVVHIFKPYHTKSQYWNKLVWYKLLLQIEADNCFLNEITWRSPLM